MLSQTKNIVIGLAITFMAVTTASAETYLVDPAASEMAFNIRHTVGFNSGFVRKFSGEVDIRKYELRDVSLKADMTSITT
ncbi:MAG: hypothetical protein KC897_13640, partial [Candidatus Omnitrophica bacterium]|nr:hypothetical protein [Candidatus Omnitrophota bacterium]